MYFVGIDLAWGERSPTGLAVADSDGTLVHLAATTNVGQHARWVALRDAVRTATRKADLRRAEDPVDAVVCADVAMFATRRPADVTSYGDDATGRIVTPALSRAATPDAWGR